MKVKEILQKAESLTISHAYGDGTYLFDVLYDGKVAVIRQHLNAVNLIRKTYVSK